MSVVREGTVYFQSLEDELKPLLPFIKGVVLNAGCGHRNIDDILKKAGGTEIINYDIESSILGAIIGSLVKTPFEDNSFDTIFTNAVLEHVPDIHTVMAEFKRILKPEGILVAAIPFLQPFHPCPTDFRRYTKDGLEELALLHGFKVEAIYPVHNIAQTIGWILLEWARVHKGWRMPVVAPLCYLMTRFNTKTDFKMLRAANTLQLVCRK